MKGKMIQNNTWFKMLITLCVLTLLTGMITGCAKKPADNAGNNEEVTQVTNEDEEQPTVDVEPSEEPEVVEPAPSEEPLPSEEVEQNVEETLVEEVDCIGYVAISNWYQANSYDELKILTWPLDSSGALLSNGASYEIAEEEYLYLYIPGTVENVDTITSSLEIIASYENVYGLDTFGISSGEEIEITCSVTYVDGSEQAITVTIIKN